MCSAGMLRGIKNPGWFEGRQTARSLGGPRGFLPYLNRNRPGAQDGEQGHGPHGERDVPIPAGPAPDFILILAHFTRGRFKATRDGSAGAGRAYDRFQRGILVGKDHIARQVGGIAHAASPQQPAAANARHPTTALSPRPPR